ncbi:MAG: hypothetical protein M0P71_00825 [Melioribacteraceae bacterium]|nr:hypothetical protein [Melioribacteraceae bacterium]
MNVGQMLDAKPKVKETTEPKIERVPKIEVRVNGKLIDPTKLATKKAEVKVDTEPERELDYDKKLRKSNLVTRLRKLSVDKKMVSFLVLTPASTTGRKVQSVIMKDFEVKETSESKFIITGRDIEHEVNADLDCGLNVTKHICTSSREKEDCIFRSYRIDRILGHTMTWS